MKSFRLIQFCFQMWFRFQIVSLLAICLYCISILSKETNPSELLWSFILEPVNAFFSGLACISYGIIVFFWTKRTRIETFRQLKVILHHAGWINAVAFMAFILFILRGMNLFVHISLKDIQEISEITLAPTLIGQISILWAIKRCVTFEKTVTPHFDSLIEEIGKNEQ
jgi:hypothetical protein